jgi:DNA-binding response OmpR family regulator
MANREYRMRTCVIIVEPDVKIGIKLADWLAAHGYQAVLIRSVEAAIEELRDVRTRLVFVGGSHSEPAALLEISEILRVIRAACPAVPMLTIADWANEDVTQIVFREGVDQVLVRPA